MTLLAHALTLVVLAATAPALLPSPNRACWAVRSAAGGLAPQLAVLAGFSAGLQVVSAHQDPAHIVAATAAVLCADYWRRVRRRQLVRAAELGVPLDSWRRSRPPTGIAASSLRPIVLLVPGDTRGSGPEQVQRYASWLSEHGYVTVCLPRLPRTNPLRTVQEVLSWLHWARANACALGADPDRIALLGCSRGAELVLWAAGLPTAPAVRAVLALHPMLGLPLLHRTLLNTRTTSPRAPDPHGADNPPHAVFLAAGERDQFVPLPEVHGYAQELLSRSTEHRVVLLPDADHCVDRVWQGLPARILRHTLLEFLRRHLNP